MKQTFSIRGMHCASCVGRIEGALKEVPGVHKGVANLATEKATVDYDPAKVTEEKLKETISGAGYQALTEDATEESKKKELDTLRRKVVVSLFLGTLILWGSFPGLMETAPAFLKLFWVQMLLATPVQLWVGWDFYRTAISSLKHRTANMDTLVAMGTTVAFGYSVVVTLFPSLVQVTGVESVPYFDVSTIIIGLILLGRYFEARAKAGTSQAIKKLIGLQAKTAKVIRGGQEVDLPIDQVVTGDEIRVRPGEKIPVDGVIVSGESSI